jgi:predicted enzyme related to lactoylglutathione lyase
MVQEVAVVWQPVTDMDEALGFYRDRLGLQELRNEGEWAELDANGVRLGLNAREEPRGSGGTVVAFQPEGGLDSAVEELRSAGVEVAGEISEHPWGRVATLKDPDGNDVQLYEPPSG